MPRPPINADREHPCRANVNGMSRRCALQSFAAGTMTCMLVVSAALHAQGTDLPPAGTPHPTSTSDTVFARSSFWYQPLSNDVPLNPKSAQYVEDFLRQKKKYFGTVAINTTAYASPVYRVGRDVPTVKVTRDCGKQAASRDPSLDAQWAEVPIPANAKPARGTDAEMSVYQPSTDRLWEFWKMSRTPDGEWRACWGGRMDSVSKSIGNFPKRYGTTATSLPFIGGQITAEELRRGEIRHVIGIGLVDTEDWHVYSWPAKRSDGWNPNKEANRIPEGLRFRLDPAVNVDALKMHPLAKVIAKAAQKYGFVVWDHAGAITVRAENPYSYTFDGGTDPYPELFAGTAAYAILEGFPWDRLQFLPMDYGRPAGVHAWD